MGSLRSLALPRHSRPETLRDDLHGGCFRHFRGSTCSRICGGCPVPNDADVRYRAGIGDRTGFYGDDAQSGIRLAAAWRKPQR